LWTCNTIHGLCT